MSLEKASIVWSAKQLSGMVKNGKIDFNHIVQRSYVWEKARKSGLIESMIIGYPVPPAFAKRVDDGSGKRGSNVYHIMDGKQRLSTIKEYLNDEFALTTLSPVTYMDDELGEEVTLDVSGMKFSELPDGLQNYLQTVTFNVTYFDNLTKEEERELFKRLNAGKPLSTKSRLLASCQDIEGLLDIGSHNVFEDMLTAKSIDNKNQVTLVMKSWCMMNQDIKDVSFESKVFNPLLEKTEVTDEEKLALIEVFDYAYEVHAILKERKEKVAAKKLYKETHFISLIPYMQKSVEDGVDSEMFADWVVEFFGTDNTSVSDAYNEAANNGAAKNVNIVTRDIALKSSYENFFKVDVDNEEETENSEGTLAVVEDESEENSVSITDEIMNDIDNSDED